MYPIHMNTTNTRKKITYAYALPCGRIVRETRKAGYQYAILALSTTGVWWTVGLRTSARSAASLAATCPSGTVVHLTTT